MFFPLFLSYLWSKSARYRKFKVSIGHSFSISEIEIVSCTGSIAAIPSIFPIFTFSHVSLQTFPQQSEYGGCAMLSTMFERGLKKIGIFGSLKPFVWIGNIFGVFPCQFSDNRLKTGSILVRIWLFVFFGIRSSLNIILSSEMAWPPNQLLAAAFIITNVGQWIAAIADFAASAFCEKSFVKFYEKLTIYDNAVGNLGHPRTDRVRTYWFFLFLTNLFAAGGILTIWKKETNWVDALAQSIFLLINGLIYLLAMMKFALLVHLLCQRFEHLNEMILSRASWTCELTPKNMKHVAPTDIIFLHSTLAEASRIINATYVVILPSWFFCILMTVIISIYVSNADPRVFPVVEMTALCTEILTICAVCDVTAEQGNAIGRHITKDEPTLIDGSTAMDRVRMHVYLLNNRVTFNAGGFFVLNLPVFYTMCTSVVTYSLIMSNIPRNATEPFVNATTR